MADGKRDEVTAVQEWPVSRAGAGRPVDVLETRWESSELGSAADGPAGSWLVIGRAVELRSALRAAGHRVIRGSVRRPSAAAVERLTDDPDFPPRAVVVAIESDDLCGPRTIRAEQRAILAITRLVREMVARPGLGARLWVVTRDKNAETRGLRSLIRVLAFEHPELRASIMNVHGAPPSSVLNELHADTGDDEIALQGTDRWVSRLRQAELGPRRAEPAMCPGAYVISGGLGGLGLTVARWLVERGARRIVLNDRKEPSAYSAGIIEELSRSAEVAVVLGDVSGKGVADRLVWEAAQGRCRLRGVVHAAGVPGDRCAVDMDEATLHRVWKPRVWGAWRLHEATAHLDLDWWVSFSSSSALLGAPGEVATATANAWVDDLVRQRRAAGLAGTTVQWGVWGELGGAPDPLTGVLAPLSTADAVEALESVLASSRVATGVTRLDAGRVTNPLPGMDGRAFFAQVMEEQSLRAQVLDVETGPAPGDQFGAARSARKKSTLYGPHWVIVK